MEKDLICPICGERTRVYMGHARNDRLCGKHADQLKAGKIGIVDLDFEDMLNYERPVFADVETRIILNKDVNDIPPSLREYWIYAKKDNKKKPIKNSNSTPPPHVLPVWSAAVPQKKGICSARTVITKPSIIWTDWIKTAV